MPYEFDITFCARSCLIFILGGDEIRQICALFLKKLCADHFVCTVFTMVVGDKVIYFVVLLSHCILVFFFFTHYIFGWPVFCHLLSLQGRFLIRL